MSYTVRKGKLIRQEKPKWAPAHVERADDPEWEAWFDIVNAKMAAQTSRDCSSLGTLAAFRHPAG